MGRNHCLIDYNNYLVGCIDIIPLIGTKRKFFEIVKDISSNKIYVHLRNVENNINNSNNVGRDHNKLFPITVGGPIKTIIEESNIKLVNNLEHDTLRVGYLFCHAKTQ